MLDFRQNFGKSMTGDAYYDIAKMWHSFIVNHEMVKKDLFVVENEDANHVKIDIHRTFVDTECEKALVEWLDNSKVFDKDQADLMTAIIFLNIAACEEGTIHNTTGADHFQINRVRTGYIYLSKGKYCISTKNNELNVRVGSNAHVYSQPDDAF
jgi:hypothetical protein